MRSDKIDNFPIPVSDKKASEAAISKIRLTANNIMVRVDVPPTKSAGGIFYPEQTRNTLQQEAKRCTILAVGPGRLTGHVCEGCLGEGSFEEDTWPSEGGLPKIMRKACEVCGGSGIERRPCIVKPGDAAYFNYLSDHGEIEIEGEKVRVVRDVVLQAVEVSGTPLPLDDRILVRRSRELETTKGGIVVPDAYKEKQVEGEVLAVGPGLFYRDPETKTTSRIAIDWLNPGNVIVFGKYDGNEITVDGEKLVLMKAECALAVIERGGV